MNAKWNDAQLKAAIRKAASAAVEKAGLMLQQEIRATLNQKASNTENGGMASSGGEPPAKGTGMLAASIAVDRSGMSAINPHVRVGTNLKYAGIQEFGTDEWLGGPITPKKGKALAIPIGVEGRKAARQAGTGGLRTLDLVLLKGKGILARIKKGRGKGNKPTIEPLFVLRTEVTLPERPYFRPTLADNQDKIRNMINEAIARVIKK